MKRLTSFVLSIVAVALIVLEASCHKNKKHIKLQINLECTPTNYFDTLSHVLLSNDYEILGAKRNWRAKEIDEALFPGTVYIRNLKRNNSGDFMVEDIEKGQYEYILIEAYLSGALYTGLLRKLDFRESSDTAAVTICIQPNMQTGPN